MAPATCYGRAAVRVLGWRAVRAGTACRAPQGPDMTETIRRGNGAVTRYKSSAPRKPGVTPRRTPRGGVEDSLTSGSHGQGVGELILGLPIEE